jgi:hypothetical protein
MDCDYGRAIGNFYLPDKCSDWQKLMAGSGAAKAANARVIGLM